MTLYCSECAVNWWPYQAKGGVCPQCGGGTVARQEPASAGAEELFRLVSVVAEKRAVYARFEAFYAEREIRLNGLDTLPVAEPRRAA